MDKFRSSPTRAPTYHAATFRLARRAEWRPPQLHAAFDVVFVDPSGTLNLLADMSRTSYRDLRSHARRAIADLARDSTEGFESLFLRDVGAITVLGGEGQRPLAGYVRSFFIKLLKPGEEKMVD